MSKPDNEANQRLEFIVQQYREKIVEVYDARNKGSYFHYDWQLNKERGGIHFDNGGDRLIEGGLSLISDFVVASVSFLTIIQEGIRKQSQTGNFVKDFFNGLRSLEAIIKNINERRPCEEDYYFPIFGEATKFPELSLYKFKLGELLFHQIRVREISHACEGYPHLTCHNIRTILQNMPSDFLKEDKKKEFGEALAKELLGRKIDFQRSSQGKLPSFEAKEALRNYRVESEDVHSIVDQCILLEAKHYASIKGLKRKLDVQQENYTRNRKKLLEKIGIIPVLRD